MAHQTFASIRNSVTVFPPPLALQMIKVTLGLIESVFSGCNNTGRKIRPYGINLGGPEDPIKVQLYVNIQKLAKGNKRLVLFSV
jgi:hypothetical protein